MPSKNNLSSIKLKSTETLKTAPVSNRPPWRQPKPPAEKCSEPVVLKFTPLEMEKIKETAGMVPLATFLKNALLSDTDVLEA